MNARYTHTNIATRDWRRLVAFYRDVFGCRPVPPERDLSGPWLDRITGVEGSHIRGMHLRLPGHGDQGPTLEIFQYDEMPEHPAIRANTPALTHIAFAVDDVAAAAERVRAHGGSAIGELVVRVVPGVGRLTVQYMADPDGNLVELQHHEPT